MRWWIAVIACALAVRSPADADKLAPADLAKKNDGGYFTGLPLVAFSTDLGFGGGARLYYYWDGHRDDPRFADTPYLLRVFLQAFASTRGLQFHWLDIDAPKLSGTPYRFRSQLIYERNINQNYFGLGSRGLAPLMFPGSGKTYGSYSDYVDDQQKIDTGGNAWSKYDQYDFERPFLIASIERNLLEDRVRVMAGFGVAYNKIRDYTGKQVDAVDSTGKDTMAPEGETRLHAECAAGLVVGCAGGRENYLRLGISYDTRDFEPDPNSGVFLDASVDAGTFLLGSEYDYVRAMAAARGYWSPVPESADLVLAGRAVFEVQTSGTPFFSMDTFNFTDDPRAGLGGHRTLRGYRQDRFVGPVYTLGNLEARWTWGHGRIWGQKLAFILVPFFDLGRPYDKLSDLTWRDWRASYGGAFRVSWNLATVITVDYGRSSEDAGFYINFNHIF
jgi:outer membrane protein assembly factor BamA